MIKIPDYCKFIFEYLENKGFECYAVGGCVRDSIMSLKPQDWDFTTDATPDEICEVFSEYKLIDIGKKFGTICVVAQNRSFEITTFRSEGGYSDNRHPDSVSFCTSIEDDLSRRDFTMNSIAYCEKKGFIDPFGGISDIENKTIRCTGCAVTRFSEDALRIFRAIRFSSVLGFKIEENTSQAIHKLKDNLSSVHPHRMKKELSKLLCGNFVSEVLLNYSEVLAALIPEIRPMFNCVQNNPHHKYDVWTHTVKSIEFSPVDLIIRLSLLFHDSGKPFVKTTDKKGIDHFINHPKKSCDIVSSVLERFGFSKAIINDTVLLVKYHDERFRKKSESVKIILGKLSEDLFYKLLKVSYCDISAQSDYKRSEKLSILRFAANEAKKIIENRECYTLSQLAVDGTDIIELGYKGEKVGVVLNAILKEVIRGKVNNDKESLLCLIKSGKLSFFDD